MGLRLIVTNLVRHFLQFIVLFIISNVTKNFDAGRQNWGGDLETDFERLGGYSLRPWILAVTSRVLGSAEETERFLFDFRLTHAGVMASNCYRYFQQRPTEENLQLLTEPYRDGP
jgi:alpha-L-rhamnosidase